MVCDSPFYLPYNPFILYCKIATLHYYCFKGKTFLLDLNHKSHLEMYFSQFFFYVEATHESNYHDQACANDFQHVIRVF